MIDKIIQYISSFIYPRNVDVYSLETDYMDVHGTNFEEIYQMKINNNEKENLLRKISYLSKVNEYEIDNYSETLVLNNCNLSSTVLCQLEVLRKLHTDENYRNQMIDEIQVKKQNIKFKERIEAEYFTILHYLRKKKITPSKELSKQEVIDLYKNKIYVTL